MVGCIVLVGLGPLGRAVVKGLSGKGDVFVERPRRSHGSRDL